MENKKLLKYLLKDLSELEEMFSEKEKNSFDELEMEFIQNRVVGAKKLVQMFLEHENVGQTEIKPDSVSSQKSGMQQIDFSVGKTGVWVEEINTEIKPDKKISEVTDSLKVQGVVVQESPQEVKIVNKTPEIVIEKDIIEAKVEEKIQVVEREMVNQKLADISVVDVQEKPVTEVPGQQGELRTVAVQQELELDDEEPDDIHHKRLGDIFSKEKSVNDIMSDDISKLEHKLSNRPVASLHSAIGINDRFQYVRELFEGSVDNFVKTVADLDSMNDIKDAVNYLQTNFKWKKNETSLKFINLIKRRFPNE